MPRKTKAVLLAAFHVAGRAHTPKRRHLRQYEVVLAYLMAVGVIIRVARLRTHASLLTQGGMVAMLHNITQVYRQRMPQVAHVFGPRPGAA